MAHLTQYSNSVPLVKFDIDQLVMTIGQDFEMDICVPEEGVADNHAVVEAIKQGESYQFTIKSHKKDLELDLNGYSVSDAKLKDGDWVAIGDAEFQFTDDGKNYIKEICSTVNTGNRPKIHPLGHKIQGTTVKLKESNPERPMTTQEFIENSRRNRRRRLSF